LVFLNIHFIAFARNKIGKVENLQQEINSHFESSLSLAVASLLSFAARANVDGLRG